VLTDADIIDLSQPLGPATPPWPGGVAVAAKVTGTHDPDGYYARRVALDEHIGTHFDAPAHFAPGGATVEAIPAADLVRPAVVVDASAACALDDDHAITAAEFEAHETAHGRIPAGCAVLVRTGWDAHRSDPGRYVTNLRFPGLHVDAARLLVDRGVVGIGIDTLSVDRGSDAACPAHHVTLPAGLWQLEGLVGLERLPATGSWVVVGVPPLVSASGFVARVIAIVPR
jgi:kynurenine formamidase